MASTHVLVTVLDRGSPVETGVRRPVRLAPNGYAGVAYAGSVFPLHQGDVIDLSEPSWEKEDCYRFLMAGTEPPYAPEAGTEPNADVNVQWHLESNTFGHYVVFDAPERVAAEVVATLESAGLEVQRWDVSHRPADDGRFYDWFARLRFKGSHDDAVALVGAALAGETDAAPELVPVDPTMARLERAEVRVEELLDQLYETGRRAEAAEREAARLRSDLEAAAERDEQRARRLAQAEHRHATLTAQLAAIRDAAQAGPDLDALIKQLAEEEELSELALAENALLMERALAAEEHAATSGARTRDLEDQVEQLIDRVTELQALENERRRSTTPRVRRGGVAEFIPLAFRRLEFVLDSVDVIANLDSPASAMQVLAQIDAGHLVGKDLEGIRGWYEVTKIATGIAGSEDLGRIYYKPDSGSVVVSVHVKQDDKQQRRHIERLRAF